MEGRRIEEQSRVGIGIDKLRIPSPDVYSCRPSIKRILQKVVGVVDGSYKPFELNVVVLLKSRKIFRKYVNRDLAPDDIWLLLL